MKKLLILFAFFIAPIAFFSCDEEEEPVTPEGSINGTVTDAQTGALLQGVKISLSGTSVATAQTGSNGAYSFPVIDPGQYRITAEHAGYVSNNIDVTVREGQSMRGDLSMQPASISVSPNSLLFASNETLKTVQISSIGGSVDFTVATDRSWMSVNPKMGTVANQITTVTVTVDRSGLSAGNYDGTILVTSTNNSSQVLTVTMVVE